MYGLTMIIILFLVFFLNAAKDNFVGSLMFVVAVDPKHLTLSNHLGALVTTGYYASYAFGRLVYSFLGLVFPVQVSHHILSDQVLELVQLYGFDCRFFWRARS